MRIALVLAVLLFLPASAHAQTPAPLPEIVASGVGRVMAMPDRATIDLMVETRAETAAEAGAENAKKQRAVLDTLRRLGFGADEVSTTRYAVNADMRYSGERGQQLVGYVARNTVRVSVRDLDRLPEIIDGALAAGANNIGGIEYRSTRQRELEMQALDSAVANARARAEVLARAAGGRLGPMFELTTELGGRGIAGGVAFADSMRRVEQSTPITPGQLTISAVVLGRWRFEPQPR